MAGNTKVRGITIELGADTTGISKALGSLNSEINKTSKELKDVEKLLKLDPGNTELLAQKQRLLTKAITESEQKVVALKEAQAQVNTETEEGRRQYDAIQREIVACTQEQAKWKNQLDSMPGTMDKIAAAAGKISQVTGELADKTAGISKVAGGLVAGALGMAYKAGQSADEINTLAQQYGVATDQIQKFNYAQELVDVSTDTMLSSMAKLTKQIGSGNAAFEELGVSIKDANGEYRSAEDVWYDTLEALSKVENATERDILAQELFGKSAADLAGIIDDGGAALKKFGQEAEDAGLILGSDALDAANDFNNAMDKMKATAGQAFMEAGATLAEELLPHLEKLAEVVNKALQWFSDLDGDTQGLILTFLGLVAAISPVLKIVSVLSAGVSTLATVFTFLSGPIGIAVLAITGLIAAGVLLFKHWDELKAYAIQLKDNFVETFTGMRDAVVGAFTQVVDWARELPAKIANGILAQIGLVKSAAEQLGQSILDKLSERFENMKQVGRDLISKVKEGISDAFGGIKDFLGGIGADIVGGIWNGISDAIGTFTENVRGFFSNIVSSVKSDLQIQSPSKVFAYIGEMMGAGLTQGWEEAIAGLNPAVDVMAMASGAAAAANTYNFTNNVNLYGQYHERDGMSIAMSIDRWLGERI